MAKIALITQRENVDSYGEKTDVLESAYVSFFGSLGVTCFPVSNFIENPAIIYEITDVSLLILTGGGSLQPEYYVEDYGYSVQKNRDKIEKALLEEAMKRKTPILGICRGAQFINGYFGGKISRLADYNLDRPNGKDHQVIEISSNRSFYVNNFHNDGIKLEDLSPRLKPVFLDSEKSVVEGFVCEEYNLLALQWHPERRFEAAESRQTSTEIIKDFFNKYGISSN